ncbi:MAG: hypothetical protein HRT68_08550 [Flavobacteriaceae bacterium]|nr:hypothetical protein [Flavobacteriaceae bacterium]
MIKKLSYLLIAISTLILWTSCRKDFETVASNGNLRFSRDTVFLDTVFTNIGSNTYNLKVYNRSDEDIHIPTVGLSQGENSYYRLNIDGIPGKVFQNIEIPAEDSIFVFVETTVDITDLSATALEFLYTDTIEFDTGTNQQNVELVTLIKDANFLFPEVLPDGSTETLQVGTDSNGDPILIDGFFLDATELHWTNEKPYVIYGYAAIAGGDELIIDPGARVHFHADSGILASSTGTLTVNGALSTDPVALENEVIFEGDRLEPSFANVPGQWGTIWLTDGVDNGSTVQHTITHATIKNATVGIITDGDSNLADINQLNISNSQIYNSSAFGIRARTSDINADNVVINNSGINSLSIELGGFYDFNHCTIANYWTNSFRSDPALFLSNNINTTQGPIFADLNANFNNCIIFGNEEIEMLVSNNPSALFNYTVEGTQIRFDNNSSLLGLPEYAPIVVGVNNLRNGNPDFQDVSNNNFNIGVDSDANARGVGNLVPFDIVGTARDAVNPDAGAYVNIVFPDE